MEGKGSSVKAALSKKLVSVAGITLIASLALAPLARAGVVDVTNNSWAPQRAGPESVQNAPGAVSTVPAGDTSLAFAADFRVPGERSLIDASAWPDMKPGGYILDLSHSITPVGGLLPHGSVTLNQTAELSSALSRSDDANAHALALPDALRTFPVGVLIVVLAIRRVQRSARRA
jgi:hypothetical protein